MIPSWSDKLRGAIRGLSWAIRTQVNFKIHLAVALAVIAAAAWLDANTLEWCALVLCIATVLAAETFNTSIEHLARAVTREHDEEIRNALDIAAGAVLMASLGAAIAGTVIFVNLLTAWPGWWTK